MKPTGLCLTSRQLCEAVQELEGFMLPTSTVATWLKAGLLKASVRHDHIRGRFHPVIFNLDDLARVRLIARLRRVGRWSPTKVRSVLADPLMRQALRAKSDLEIVITAGRVLVQSKKNAAAAAVDVPRGQFTFRFPATELIERNEEVARRIVEETAA